MAMQLTPSAKSSFIAGFALSVVAWSIMFKVDKIPFIRRFVNKERTLRWVNDNKALSIVATEVVNFGVHGISNPNSTNFALGSTLFNAIMIFVMLPLRAFMQQEQAKEVLNKNQIKTVPGKRPDSRNVERTA